MITENFFRSKTAIVTLLAACFVVLISLGVRQTFGLFFIDFNQSLNISNTAFGFAIGIQMLMWGLTGPIFGAIADRYGGHIAIISAFIFYTLGLYFLYTGPNTGIFFSNSHGFINWYWSWRYRNKYSYVSSRQAFSISNKNNRNEFCDCYWVFWLFSLTNFYQLFAN